MLVLVLVIKAVIVVYLQLKQASCKDQTQDDEIEQSPLLSVQDIGT